MVNQLQFTQPQAYSGGVDFSPLERLGYNLAQQREAEAMNADAYRLMGGGQGQPQGGGLLADLGRKFGLIPEQAPGTPPATAAVPVSPQPSGGGGSGIGTMTPNAQKWFDFAIRPVDQGGLGLSHAQAAGKVANLQAESGAGITPWGVSGDAGTAQGSAQWRGDRLRNLVEFSKANGLDYKTTEAQQAFMRHEYMGDPNAGAGGGSEGRAYAALTATNSPERAAAAVDQYYERSSGQHRGKREAGAARLARSIGAPVVAQGGYNALDAAADSPVSEGGYNALDAAANAPTDVSSQSRSYAPGAPAAALPPAQAVAAAPEAKVMQNLVSGQPAAAAGVGREQLAQMYRNPLTRPLATAILQKQMDPGTWSYQQVGDKLVAVNSRDPSLNKVVMSDTKPFQVGDSMVARNERGELVDVTPASARKPFTMKEDEVGYIREPGGGFIQIGGTNGVPAKAQRELAGNTYKADQLGLTGQKREFFLANGRLPTGDDVPAGDRRQIDKLQDVIDSSDSALNSLRHMKELSSKAWSGVGAGKLGTVTSNLPSGFGGEAGEATQELKNEMLRGALQQLKQIFTGSQSEKESAMLIELQGSINEPDSVRQKIYSRAMELVNERVKASAARQEAIKDRSMYKSGTIQAKGGEPKADPLGIR